MVLVPNGNSSFDQNSTRTFDVNGNSTINTGNAPLIVVVVFALVSQFALLPIIIVCRRRYIDNKNNRQVKDVPNEDEEVKRDHKRAGREDGVVRASIFDANQHKPTRHHRYMNSSISMWAASLSHDHQQRHSHSESNLSQQEDSLETIMEEPFAETVERGTRATSTERATSKPSRPGRQARSSINWLASLSIIEPQHSLVDEQDNRVVETAIMQQVSIFDVNPCRPSHHRHSTIKAAILRERRSAVKMRSLASRQVRNLLEAVEEERQNPIHPEQEQNELGTYTASGDLEHHTVDLEQNSTTVNFNTNNEEKRSTTTTFQRRAANLFKFDKETMRIIRLAVPITATGLIDTISDIIVLGIISLQLGTDALSAYAVQETLLEITTEFSGGAVDAVTIVASQAFGAGNDYLVGQFVQLCSFAYVIFQIPFIILWSFGTHDIMLWIGFDEHIAQMAQSYARYSVWRDTIIGVSEVIYNFYEVIDHELAVAIIAIIEALVELGASAVALLLFDGHIDSIGVVGVLNGTFFFIFSVLFSHYKGWFQPFSEGMFGSLALKNALAVKQVAATAMPLAFGSVLIHGEWEVLTVFAAYLGAAEVTAWAILGNLWEIFQASNEGIVDAGEVRVAHFCGKGRPDRAKSFAKKTVVVGLLISIVLSSIFLALGNKIPKWLTSDLAIQQMIKENIPLIGFGNILMTGGNTCWAVLGAQGRYRLATFIFFVSSWLVTIPLAAVSVYAFFLDLRGLTAAVIIGFQCACTTLGYFLLMSDWPSICEKVRTLHLDMGYSDSSDDESSDDEATDPAG